jgi:hypothetical protein
MLKRALGAPARNFVVNYFKFLFSLSIIKMGFTIENHQLARFTAPLTYVCLGMSSVNVNRTSVFGSVLPNSTKYVIHSSFDVYFSQEEKALNIPPIDRLNVLLQVDTLPSDITQAVYEKVKENFSGKTLTDV